MTNGLRPVRWSEWDGNDYPDTDNVVYFSYGFVDISRSKHAAFLATTLQRDGIADSKGHAFALIEQSTIRHGLVAYIDGDHLMSFFNPDDDYEDVERPEPATWVEIPLGDN